MHQLIRQYVTIKILVDVVGSDKEIVPFVVVDDGKYDSVARKMQVKFMICQKWLDERNLLTWSEVNDIRLGLAP